MRAFFIVLFFVLTFSIVNAQSRSAIISVSNQGNIQFNVTDESCNYSNGKITATVYNGVPPFHYLWSNGDTTQSILNLHSGFYSLTVTDSSTSFTDSAYVSHYSTLNIGSAGSNDIFHDCLGMIDYQLNGSAPYFYDFGDFTSTSVPVSNVCALFGNYQLATNNGIDPTYINRNVVITDNNGCVGYTNVGMYSVGFGQPFVNSSPSCNGIANGSVYGFLNLEDSSIMINGLPFLYYNSSDAFIVMVNSTNTSSTFIRVNCSKRKNYFQFNNLYADSYHLKFGIQYGSNIIYYSTLSGGPATDFPITISDLGNICGNVNGNIFVDYNKDCFKNQVDTAINNALLEIQPGNYFTLTDNQGNYSFNLGYGNYTINSSSTIPGLQTNCPNILPLSFTLDSANQAQTINFADTSNGIADLFVDISNSNIHPGSQCASYIYLKNNSLSYLTNDTIQLEFDSTLIYNSTNTPSTLITSNSIYWVIDSLAPFQNKNIQVSFDVPLSVNVGDAFKFIATGTTTSLETNTLNNIDSTTIIASSSYDPNVKLANPSGYSSNNLIPITQMTFDYQIDFQNTGTDTAFNVVIVDTISEDFNLLSFVQLGSSHPYILEVDSGRIIKFKFNNINLVDSGSNQLLSNGFVKYRITRETNLIEGATIHNSASIYFDNNPPVITNDAFHTLYDCENILQNFIISPILCEGTTSSFTANSSYPATFEWYYNNLFLTTDSSFTTAPLSIGFVPITLIAHTPYCNDTLSYNLNVVAIPTPNIIVNADTLTCDDPNAVSFQWYLNNVLIIGADQINYLASQSGFYTVISTDFIGCTGTSSTIYVSLTGINELNNNEINIQPNPFHNEFTLATSANNGIINSIQIYSVDGRLVYTKDKPSILSGKYKIDLSKLENAVYFLKIKTSTNNFNQVIIKQ